jgi:hypothetical protein
LEVRLVRFDRLDARLAQLSRRAALRGLSAAAAGIAVARGLGAARAAPVEGGALLVGGAKGGRNAMEVMGQLEQRGFGFTFLFRTKHVCAVRVTRYRRR